MEQIYPRALEKKLQKYLSRREIIGIRGARQVGKTTLLRTLLQTTEGDKGYVTMDDAENRKALEQAPFDFVKRWKKDAKLLLVLDEVQKVKDAGEKLKLIYDTIPELRLFISGSSSLELKTNVLPALVGRLLLFELYTFDFAEFLQVKDPKLGQLYAEKHQSLRSFVEGSGTVLPPSFQESFLSLWKEYVLFGGYPEVVKSHDDEERITLLKNIFNLYLEKDVVNFFHITDTTPFEDCLKALSCTIGQLLVVSSLAQKLHISHQKVEEFLAILQHTYTIQLLRPFSRNAITEIKKSPKVYFLDNGLRNVVLNNFVPLGNRTDAGQLMENFVFRQLLTGFSDYKINFWRTMGKAEVDFVLTKGEEIIPIEVKLSAETQGKSLHSFLDTYKPKRAIVVTLNTFAKQTIGDTTLYFIPVFYC